MSRSGSIDAARGADGRVYLVGIWPEDALVEQDIIGHVPEIELHGDQVFFRFANTEAVYNIVDRAPSGAPKNVWRLELERLEI